MGNALYYENTLPRSHRCTGFTAISGEVQLKGTALAIDTITSPKTNTKCIYYRYLIEKEERDSDGDRSWWPVLDEVKGLDFTVLDHSGEAYIKLAASAGNIDINAPQLHQSRSGDYRYTEWRLDPNDTVTLFGWLENRQQPTVNFTVEGDYFPILSTFGAAAERGELGSDALIWLWGGVTMMILTCLALIAASCRGQSCVIYSDSSQRILLHHSCSAGFCGITCLVCASSDSYQANSGEPGLH